MLTCPEYYIDTIDDARLHLIAAVLDNTLENERIFAWAYPFTWNQAIDVINKVRPDLKCSAQKDPEEGRDLSKAPNELGALLLKKWFGQIGYKNLEQSIKENLEHVEASSGETRSSDQHADNAAQSNSESSEAESAGK